MNKIRQIIIKLFKINLFISPEIKENQELVRINDFDTCKILAEEFGITIEREKYLMDKMREIFNKNSIREDGKKSYAIRPAELLIAISKECKHKNELAFVSYNLGFEINEIQKPFFMPMKL